MTLPALLSYLLAQSHPHFLDKCIHQPSALQLQINNRVTGLFRTSAGLLLHAVYPVVSERGFVSFLGTMRLNEHKGPLGVRERMCVGGIREGGLMAFVVKLQLLLVARSAAAAS